MWILNTKNLNSFVLDSYLFYFESYEHLLGFYLEYSSGIFYFQFLDLYLIKDFDMWIFNTKNLNSFVLDSYLFYIESYEHLLGFYLEYSSGIFYFQFLDLYLIKDFDMWILNTKNLNSFVLDSYLFYFESYEHLLGFYLEYSSGIFYFQFLDLYLIKDFDMWIFNTKNLNSFVLDSYLFYFESYEHLLGFYLEYSLWNILFSIFGLIFNQRLWYVNI